MVGGLQIENCGFDLLLIVGLKNTDHMGQAYGANCAVLCKSGVSTRGTHWKYNIDGCVQHCISHNFGCYDHQVNGLIKHPFIKCIMVYRFYNIFNWDNYLFEKLAWQYWFGCINDPTNLWCSSTNNYCCIPEFQDSWNQFYKPDIDY